MLLRSGFGRAAKHSSRNSRGPTRSSDTDIHLGIEEPERQAPVTEPLNDGQPIA